MGIHLNSSVHLHAGILILKPAPFISVKRAYLQHIVQSSPGLQQSSTASAMAVCARSISSSPLEGQETLVEKLVWLSTKSLSQEEDPVRQNPLMTKSKIWTMGRLIRTGRIWGSSKMGQWEGCIRVNQAQKRVEIAAGGCCQILPPFLSQGSNMDLLIQCPSCWVN